MKPLKLYEVIKICNGDELEDFRIYKCNRCGKDIPESWGIYEDDERYLCLDCAFIEGLIPQEEFIDNSGMCSDMFKACVHNDEIYVVGIRQKFPWEKSNKDYRRSQKYKDWRTAVFKRDNFTCAICGQVGGSLEAHHIKPFADFPDDRFELDNGVTLCKKCHRNVHKEKNNEWLHTGKQKHIRK